MENNSSNNNNKQDIITILKDNFIPYAGDSLLNFIPSVSDGLLRVHRKVLYALLMNGVTSDKSCIKMLRASAMAMTYYVYGDMPLTQAMKNMGNNSLNYLYLDTEGSFGDKQKRDGVGASPRYIECKLSKYSEDLLDGVKKRIVPICRNFDNTCDEPIVLPSQIPNVLLNTSQSIATGEASKIPAHNLEEVCNAFISYIKTNDIDKSIDLIKGCDLSLGGQLIYDKDEIEKIYKTGKGSYTLIGKYRYNEKENAIHIYEIPYETYIETIEDKIRELYDKGKFKEIVDIHDGSDKDGLNLIIYLKKYTNVDQFIMKLRKLTPFESKMSCNFTCLDIDNKTPKLMNLEYIINAWLTHRRTCIKNELTYDIDKHHKERKLLLALKQLLLDIDKAVAIVKSSNTDNEIITKLMEQFKIDEEEAQYVSEVKLRNLNKTWINNRITKIDELTNTINKLTETLNSEDKINDIIISQLEAAKKKYACARKTTIIYEDSTSNQINKLDMVEDYNCNIVFTKDNYIKKTMKYSDAQKLKDGDSVLQQIKATNKSKLLLFTDKANCYYLNVYDLQETQPSNLGEYIPSLLSVNINDEKVIHVVATTDYSQYIIFAFENGKVVKVPLSSYEVKTNRTKVIKAYSTLSPLIGVLSIDGNDNVDILLKTKDSRYAVINSSLLCKKDKKDSQGANTIRVTKGKLIHMSENTLSQVETNTCRKAKLGTSGEKLDL